MKKTIFLMGGIALSLLSATAFAQDPQTQQPVTTTTTTTTTTTQPIQTWDYKKNPTVLAITSQYESKYITSKTSMTDADIFPALGKYESSNTEAPAVSVTLDPENRGTVWIEGLPQGRVKAYLRKSPATYKIPDQKTEEGKDVAEGTLMFDKDANTLNILLGKPYNAADPAVVFAAPTEEPVAVVKTKGSKTKVKKVVKPKTWSYTGTKIVEVKETVSVSN